MKEGKGGKKSTLLGRWVSKAIGFDQTGRWRLTGVVKLSLAGCGDNSFLPRNEDGTSQPLASFSFFLSPPRCL